MNLRPLIGRSYAIPCQPPKTYDCWELAMHVRDMAGRYTPPHVPRADRSEKVLSRCIDNPPAGWVVLKTPLPYCLVLIGNTHCGVYLDDGNIIHTKQSTGVRIDHISVLERVEKLRFAEWVSDAKN